MVRFQKLGETSAECVAGASLCAAVGFSGFPDHDCGEKAAVLAGGCDCSSCDSSCGLCWSSTGSAALLWEAPQAQQGRGFKAEKSKEQDEELSKRVRAVAIGSGSGILLSLVVQSITPEAQEPYYYYAEPPRRMAYRRQMLAAPVPPQPPAPSFSFSSLTTGLLVGLGTGVIIGSSMNEMTEGSPEDRKSSTPKPLSKRDSGGDSAAPHALEGDRVPMRGRNSQGLLK